MYISLVGLLGTHLHCIFRVGFMKRNGGFNLGVPNHVNMASI